MRFAKSKHYDVNYLAKIVNIQHFENHPNPEVTRLKLAPIGGYRVVVDINSKPGFYVYFPALSQINPDFLRYASLFRDTTLNANPEKKGFFEKNGKVTAIKLKGQVSEGFLIEFEVFNNWLIDSVNKTVEPIEDEEFDCIEDGNKTFWINKKYIAQPQTHRISTGGRHREKKPKGISKLVDGQFRFHYDTTLIKKCPYVISPNDILSITEKWHGTSGISAYVLCHTRGNWKFKQKLIAFITKILGNNVNDLGYDYIYSSRSVIKNEFANPSAGFYGCDVWGEADKIVRSKLTKGMTLYYEIVGYLPTGSYIQKGYDYGCVPPTEGETYTYDKHFKVMVYRVTLTDPDGNVHEFSAKEVQQWCVNNGLHPVVEMYYGYAKDLYPDIPQDEHWCDNFLARLANDKSFAMEQPSPECRNNVPHEGLVLKTEKMRSEAWKLKCFAFLQGELKDETVNIEDNA